MCANALYESVVQAVTNPARASVGIEAPEDRVEKLLAELSGKDIHEVIAAGREKMSVMPVGGGGGAAPAAAAPAAGEGKVGEGKKEEAAKPKEKEKPKEVWVLGTCCCMQHFKDLARLSNPLHLVVQESEEEVRGYHPGNFCCAASF